MIWTTDDKDYDPLLGHNRTCANVRVLDNTITFAPGTGDREGVYLNAIDDLICRGNDITMGARSAALSLGNPSDLNDTQHPRPTAYCVYNNTLTPGDASANLDIAGICSACSQPESLNRPCVK